MMMNQQDAHSNFRKVMEKVYKIFHRMNITSTSDMAINIAEADNAIHESLRALISIINKIKEILHHITIETSVSGVPSVGYTSKLVAIERYVREMFGGIRGILDQWLEINAICSQGEATTFLSGHGGVNEWASNCADKFISILNNELFQQMTWSCATFVDARNVVDVENHLNYCRRTRTLTLPLNYLTATIDLYTMCSPHYVEELYRLFSAAVSSFSKLLDIHWAIVSKTMTFIEGGIIDQQQLPELSAFVNVGMSNFKIGGHIDPRLITIAIINSALLKQYTRLYSDTRMIAASVPAMIDATTRLCTGDMLAYIDQI